MKKMSFMVATLCFLFGLTLTTMAEASGGKTKAQNPLYDDDGNVVGVVHTYDSEACVVTAVDQSGKNLYVICEED